MKNLKSIINLILPNYLKNFLKKLFHLKDFYLLEGFYDTYDMANLDSVSDTGYSNLNIVKKKRFTNNLSSFIQGRYIVSSIMFSFDNNIKKILEFGGGIEPVYKYINLNRKKGLVNYVTEREELINQINIPDDYKDKIIYFTNHENVELNTIDIAIFNSSIQYHKNFQKILDDITNSKIKYILITDTIFSDFDLHKYTLQVNTKPSKFVYILLSFKKISDFFKKKNYDLIYEVNGKNHLGEKNQVKIHEKISNEKLNFKTLLYKLQN